MENEFARAASGQPQGFTKVYKKINFPLQGGA
jgi:hypothetical protein